MGNPRIPEPDPPEEEDIRRAQEKYEEDYPAEEQEAHLNRLGSAIESVNSTADTIDPLVHDASADVGYTVSHLTEGITTENYRDATPEERDEYIAELSSLREIAEVALAEDIELCSSGEHPNPEICSAIDAHLAALDKTLEDMKYVDAAADAMDTLLQQEADYFSNQADEQRASTVTPSERYGAARGGFDADDVYADDTPEEEALRRQAEAAQAQTGGSITALGIGDAPTPPFFKEQCFLLAQIPYFVAYKRDVLEEEKNEKRLPYINSVAANPGDAEGAAAEWPDASNSNACLQMGGEPFAFVNRLTQYPSYKNLLYMKTSEIANLQPLIRLFKITTNTDGEDSQFEIPFDSYFTKQDLEVFMKEDIRGVGVGIQDFTFSYEGHDPFAVKKSIKAKLTIFANNFSELLRDRAGFKYLDLALKTGSSKSLSLATFDRKRKDVVVDNLNKLNFRLKAVVGWAYRDAWNDATSGDYDTNTLSDGVKTALYNSFVTLNLTPTVHTFDIDDQGRVKFIINYLAYVEDYFDQPNFNIFPNTKAAGQELYTEEARAQRDIKAEVWAAKCDKDNFAKLKDGLQEEIQLYRTESLQALMKKMFEHDKIRYLKVSSDEINKFRQQGVNYDASQLFWQADADNSGDGGAGIESISTFEGDITPEVKTQISRITDEEDQNQRFLSLASAPTASGMQEVTFFYVSDLVDVILEGISNKYGDTENSITALLSALEDNSLDGINFGSDPMAKEVLTAHIERTKAMAVQFKKLRVLLGPLEIVNQSAKQGSAFTSDFPSMGDLPISVKYFVEWISKKMSDRDEVFYPLPKFLNDFFNNLIREFLNSSTCFANQAKQKTAINQAVITSYKESEENIDDITQDLLSYRSIVGAGDFARAGRMNINYYGQGDPDTDDYPLPVLNTAASRDNPVVELGVENEINYLVYFAGRSQPVEKMTGDETTDSAAGIFHYAIGRDRGITKTISLKKTDSTGLKELRFEQDGYDGLKQLREVFDVDISTYANVTAYPGCYIYVDPEGFAPGYTGNGTGDAPDLTQIGIGGYHMIIRSEHSFGAGRANSIIHAKWVASTDAQVTQNLNERGTSDAFNAEPVYCFTEEEPDPNPSTPAWFSLIGGG